MLNEYYWISKYLCSSLYYSLKSNKRNTHGQNTVEYRITSFLTSKMC